MRRRAVLVCFAFVASVATACLPPTTPGTALFPDGVAAGDVTPTGATVWVRTSTDAQVDLAVHDDIGLSGTPVFSGSASTSAATDHTAKIEVTGLQPGTTYYYRWTSGSDVSQTGRFVTAPSPGSDVSFSFVYAGDSDGLPFAGPPAFNAFEVLDRARLETPAFFAYLGDTIYSDSGQEPSDATTLDEYRDRYDHNRSFAHLRNLMSATGTYAQPDDHEVYNDYDGQTVDPSRYANGWQAFHDWMPTNTSNVLGDPTCAGDPRYINQRWGTQAEIFVLDQRSCRSDSAIVESVVCEGDLAPTAPASIRTAAGLTPAPPAGCIDAIFDPDRTMLGPVQKARFKSDLQASTAKWKIVLSELAWQQFWALPYDRWEGYGAERNEILNFIRDENIEGVVFLTTDNHANIFNEVFIDVLTDPEPIAYEAINGPIATNTFEQEIIDFVGPDLVDDFQLVLSLLGVDCRAIDTYAYGLVFVNAGNGRLTVVAKDANGQVVTDDLDPNTRCRKVLGP